jgi:hypothetical protein
VETYIGQALGPFNVPCHRACDFRDPEWKSKTTDKMATPNEVIQCAGMAVYRSNIGVAGLMPDALPCLPASEDVFANAAEFMAHHEQIPLREARRRLEVTPPRQHLLDQLRRQDNVVKILLPQKKTP